MELISKLWDIQAMKWDLLVEYWYIVAIVFGTFLIAGFSVYLKNKYL